MIQYYNDKDEYLLADNGEILTDDSGNEFVVNRFIYTASAPIYAYGSPLQASSSYNWTAGSVVNLVYNGSYWSIVDSSSLSRIQQTADSIIAMVSRAQTTVASKYGTCSTAAGTEAKAVKCSDFSLYTDETIAAAH